MAYYTLGKKRKEISPEELKKYEELFENYFLKSFTSRLTDYSDPKINVLSAEIVNKNIQLLKLYSLKQIRNLRLKLIGEYIQKTLTIL